MADNADTVSGIVLAKEQSGERHLKLTLLSPERGIVACLLRVSSKSTETAADIFDHAEVTLNVSRDGGPRFAKDYRVTRREAEIGSDYARLALACRWALVLVKNPPPAGSSEEIFALCAEAIHAFATRPRPDVTLFKSLWKLIRGEGYPVQEHWLSGLANQERAEVTAILKTPLDAQTASLETVTRVTRDLERWLENECHFFF